MADLQHSSQPHASVHEPRHITLNGTSASGTVITNSSSSAGISEYRRLTQADINNVDQTIEMLEIDSTTVQTHYWNAPFVGTVEQIRAVANIALVASPNTWEVQIEGVQVTGTPVTLAAGGGNGDSTAANATANQSFVVGDNITVLGTTIGNTDAGVNVRFIITVRRS